MIAQSVVMPNQVCPVSELYFRSTGNVQFQEMCIRMQGRAVLATNTYMNLFDTVLWSRYTKGGSVVFHISMRGCGDLRLYCSKAAHNRLIRKIQVDTKEYEELEVTINYSENRGYIFWEAATEACLEIKNAFFCMPDDTENNDIHLGIVICTYKRKEDVCRSVTCLKASRFFCSTDELYGRMSVRIIDNASELPIQNEPYISIYHNSNTGGSGGFARGMAETRKEENKYGITNVILMDDDVEFIPETFYRIYAFLSLLKPEYKDDVIAGRMFCTGKREYQYTACEIWNGGNIRHVGGNLDMTAVENLCGMNQPSGEYTGWWFGCFPMEFVRANNPLQLFLHCDDVEYGLRHGKTPLVLNGVQVWHETYEQRQTPIIAYYDTRNPLIVNARYGLLEEREVLLLEWKKKISKQHVSGNYLTERMMILGMRDFLRGERWLRKLNGEQYHRRLKRNIPFLRVGNAFLWRLTAWKMKTGVWRK